MTDYANQSEAKAAARKAANYIGLPVYIYKMGKRYVVTHQDPGPDCVCVRPEASA